MKELFLKCTKKGREVFRTCKLHTLLAVESRRTCKLHTLLAVESRRTCKLHTLLAVESRQNNDKTERVAIKGTISDVFAELKRQLRFFDSHLCQAQAGCLHGYYDFKV